MQALEAVARSGRQVNVKGKETKSKNDEKALAAEMRLQSEFVENVMSTGQMGAGKPVITDFMRLQAANQTLPVDFVADTATMHPANMVGNYHAWKIKSSYPIPGSMLNDDYRRRFLAMYASQQDKALEPSRRQREMDAEVAIAVVDRFEEHRLPSNVEKLLGQIEGVLQEKDRAVEEVSRKTRVYEGTEEQTRFFQLLREKKVRQVEDMFARGEVNVAVVEPGSSATGLLRSVSLGLLTIVKLFLKGGADCDYANPRGIAAIHCVWDAWLKLKAGHVNKRTRYLITKDMLGLLLEYGADANLATSTGLTALHMAATFGHDDMVATLLRFGADRQRKDEIGRTPLDCAKQNNNTGCIGLLANWGYIDKAMKFEEYRKEWQTALNHRIHSERHFLGRVGAGKDSKENVSVAQSAAKAALAAVASDPMKAGAIALAQGRSAMMKVAGPASLDPIGSTSADKLVEALRLQEHLRERRLQAAHDEMVSNPLHDPSTALQIAEYDMNSDSLRAIDAAADLEAVGDTEGAKKLRLAGAEKNHAMLPWGRRAVKTIEEADHDMDELSRALAEEEAKERDAEERRARDEAVALASKAKQGVDHGGKSHKLDLDGLAAAMMAEDSDFSHLIRSDSTRDITKGLYGEANLPGVAKGAILASTMVSPHASPPTSKVGTPHASRAGTPTGQGKDVDKARASLMNVSTASKGMFSGTRQPGEWSAAGGGDGAGSRRQDEAGSDDEKPMNIGPPADTAALHAASDAIDRKAHARRWRDEMKKKERDRGKIERNEVRRIIIAKQGEGAAAAGSFEVVGTEGRDELDLGVREAARMDGLESDSEAEEEAKKAKQAREKAIRKKKGLPERSNAAPERRGSNTGSVDSDGVPMSERLAAVIGDADDDLVDIGNMTVEELKAHRFRKKMNKYYYGQAKDAASDGSTLRSRRKAVASAITNDIPELLPEYTRITGAQVITRKPTVTSAILRPARFRVDTRTTVDSENVFARGKAFEVLMAGAVNHGADLDDALGIVRRTEGTDEQEDAAAPPRPGLDARSLSQHAQASVHDPVAMAELDKLLAGPQGEERRRLLDEWSPLLDKPVGFGDRAVNPAALLPATSSKRADAEARDASRKSGGRAPFGSSASSTLAGGGGQQISNAEFEFQEREKRTRRLLVEAKSEMSAEAMRSFLLRSAMDDSGNGPGMGSVKGSYTPAATGQDKYKELKEKEDREKESKKKIEKLIGPETYGQGLLSAFPLHSSNRLTLEPGQTLLGLSTLHTLAQSRAEFDTKTEINRGAYAKYAEVKQQKAEIQKAKSGVLLAAAAGKGTLAKLTEMDEKEKAAKAVKPSIKGKRPVKPKPPTEAEKAAEAVRAAEKMSIPLLTPAAAEALSMLQRKAPDRPLWDPNVEEDRRQARDPHYAVFTNAQDPWSKTGFSYRAPLDKFELG